MSFRAFAGHLRSLLTNPFFWGGLAVLFGLFAVVYLLFNNVLMPAYTRQDVAVTVPDVMNRGAEEAIEVLSRADLRVEQVAQRFNPNLPRNVVIDQVPEPNTQVKPGRRIFITVNTGRTPMVKVPPVRDMSLREARNRLSAVGLRVEETLADSIPSPYPNTVTRQEPAPGDSLTEGSGVRLWYSTGLGNEYVEVPDVTSLTVAEAQARLLELKLRAVVVGGPEGVHQDEETLGEQTVVRQSREPGTLVREGFEVRLFIEQAEEVPEG